MPGFLPQRHENHVLEELSERYFRASLPREWTVERCAHDYGVDLKVEIFERGEATGMELLVQLKSSQASSQGADELLRLKTSTYNYLWDKLQVVLLVKYVVDIDKAYWLLLKEVPTPNQGQETFTVHIPTIQMVDDNCWDEILSHVKRITHQKLSVTRP